MSFSLLFLALLILPTIQYVFHVIPEKALYGYVEKNIVKPENKLTGWFNKDLQRYLESVFDYNIGFKSFGVKLFNEITFRLFGEQQRINIYSTKKHGLYSKMSIDSLNEEYIHHNEITKNYINFSKKIAELQRLLEKNEGHLEIVISSSKPYLHPDGLGKRFLIDSYSKLFAKKACLSCELKKVGVNVLDSRPILRKFYTKTKIDTHPYSGLHWNYYAGCITARALLKHAKKSLTDMPILTCGKPIYKKPEMTDKDGLLLLNVLTDVNIEKSNPYPSPTAVFFNNYKPKILIVGDSFMDQMLYSLYQTKAYSNSFVSSYFQTRVALQEAPNPLFGDSTQLPSTNDIQNTIINDALNSDLIVLQMVDYNISRYGYGFVEALISRLKNQ